MPVKLLSTLLLVLVQSLLSTISSAAGVDPPGRVGRLSLASQGVRLQVGDSVAEGNAALNWPVTTGAIVETSGNARAEVRIGSSSLYLDGDTYLEVAELSDERIWLRLHRGSAILGIQNPEHASETVMDALQGRLRFAAPGSYRVDVAGGTAGYSAYTGTAYIDSYSLEVHPGERILLLGGADRNYVLGRANADAFRHWSLDRDRLASGPEGNQRVPSEMTGTEDLDRYGAWEVTSEYGAVWYPQGMPTGWAPYRWGDWVWVSPWGWTWIDRAPWGFAPFHYGRWALLGGRWAWMPGAYVARPVYAPALVAWQGNPGWHVAPRPTSHWVPLGPRETYLPHYRASPRHIHEVNAGRHAPPATRRADGWNHPQATGTPSTLPPLTGPSGKGDRQAVLNPPTNTAWAIRRDNAAIHPNSDRGQQELVQTPPAHPSASARTHSPQSVQPDPNHFNAPSPQNVPRFGSEPVQPHRPPISPHKGEESRQAEPHLPHAPTVSASFASRSPSAKEPAERRDIHGHRPFRESSGDRKAEAVPRDPARGKHGRPEG